MKWADARCRCNWANPNNPVYLRYHDEEWGVPVHEDRKLFELLVLESFQAGLSWECVLMKREAFRQAFDDFDAGKMAAYGEEKVQELLQNPGIIRHERKIRAAIQNAAVFLRLQKEFGSFDAYLETWTGQTIRYETGRTASEVSDALSRDLKKCGMRFLGSTTVYAYLQAVGRIWGHEPQCYLYGTRKPSAI